MKKRIHLAIKPMTAAKLMTICMSLICMSLVCVSPTFAQSTQQPSSAQSPVNDLKAMRSEVEALKAGQTAMQKQLEEIKQLLRAAVTAQPRAANSPEGAVVNIAGLPAKGSEQAQITVVEFSDIQCPFCSRYVRDTLPSIVREYVEKGKVRYVFSDLPLESIHPQAVKAAEATHCAGDQGKYWQMHDQLFANPRALSMQELSQHAQAVGLNVLTFQQCLFTDKHTKKVKERMAEAERLGVNGTPSFLVAVKTANTDEVKVVKVLSGAQPFASFKSAIDGALGPENQQPTVAKESK